MPDVTLACGNTVRVEAITPHVFRVRLRPAPPFPEPGLVRYGIVRTEWPEVPVTVADGDATMTFATVTKALQSQPQTTHKALTLLLSQDR